MRHRSGDAPPKSRKAEVRGRTKGRERTRREHRRGVTRDPRGESGRAEARRGQSRRDDGTDGHGDQQSSSCVVTVGQASLGAGGGQSASEGLELLAMTAAAEAH